MKMYFRFVFLLGVFLLCGCVRNLPGVQTRTFQNFKMVLNSWVGKDLDSLFKVWGYPTRIDRLPNHNKLFVYQVAAWDPYRVFPDIAPLQVRHTPHGLQYVIDPIGCTTWFEVNPTTAIIVGTHYKGDNCAVTPAFVAAKSYDTSSKEGTL